MRNRDDFSNRQSDRLKKAGKDTDSNRDGQARMKKFTFFEIKNANEKTIN